VHHTRREFLKLVLAAGAAGRFAEASEPGDGAATADRMPRRTLGRTKESVTILGLGCAYIGNGFPESQTRDMLEAALEGGVRYFDTSCDYKLSEVRLGPVLAPVRDEIFLVTKINSIDAKGAEKELAQSLKLLKTDHVDLLLQHCIGAMIRKPEEINTILSKAGSLEILRKAKQEGLTRFIGMSVHAPHASALRLLDGSDEWDVLMPFINYVSDAQRSTEGEGDKLFARARRDNLGVVAMKVMGGYPGTLAEDYDRAFRYALSVPGVACALVGTRKVAEVKRAIRAVKELRPMNDAEMKETMRIGEEMVRSKSSDARILLRHRRSDFGSTDFA
jgi:predicted aldo/keto reductase-like oxidoreductase